MLFGNPLASNPTETSLFTIPFAANTTQRKYSPDFSLSLYSKLILLLTGTLSKTEACAGALVGEQPYTLIKGIRVKADGAVIKEIDGPHLRVLDHHIGRGLDSTGATGITLGTDASEAFACRLELDFQTLRSALPRATNFPGHRYGKLAFEVDWGNYTPDLLSGGVYSAVSFGAATQLEVRGVEVHDPVQMNGEYMLRKSFQQIESVSSIAQTAKPFQLPIGDVYRGILLSQYTDAPRAMIATLVAATANIVVKVRTTSGIQRVIETTWAELTRLNTAQYGIALPTGYAFIDFMADGDFSKALRADGPNVKSVEVLVDTASVANAKLQFTGDVYSPARAA